MHGILKMDTVLNTRQEICTGLRGRFLVPVLSALAELDLLKPMQSGSFRLDDFESIPNRHVLRALIDYLESVGLLEFDNVFEAWSTTELGESMFRRAGAALILESYQDYFDRLPELLTSDHATATCDRRKNVLGSGSLHQRKFFPPALEILSDLQPDTVIDLGCGDGTFLSLAMDRLPQANAIGVDLSEVAIAEAETRLTGRPVNFTTCDASKIDEWSRVVPRSHRPVVVMWFVLHEFAQKQTDIAVDFFKRLHAVMPQCHVLLGEVVAHRPNDLAAAKLDSAMPEFSLFHALSGQGLLSWNQLEELRDSIPFHVAAEHRIDAIKTDHGSVPGNLILHLEPKGNYHV